MCLLCARYKSLVYKKERKGKEKIYAQSPIKGLPFLSTTSFLSFPWRQNWLREQSTVLNKVHPPTFNRICLAHCSPPKCQVKQAIFCFLSHFSGWLRNSTSILLIHLIFLFLDFFLCIFLFFFSFFICMAIDNSHNLSVGLLIYKMEITLSTLKDSCEKQMRTIYVNVHYVHCCFAVISKYE